MAQQNKPNPVIPQVYHVQTVVILVIALGFGRDPPAPFFFSAIFWTPRSWLDFRSLGSQRRGGEQ